MFLLQTNGSHETATTLRAITRVYVHMFTREALWAVVGVAVPRYQLTTVLADKILFGTFKLCTHGNIVKLFS